MVEVDAAVDDGDRRAAAGAVVLRLRKAEGVERPLLVEQGVGARGRVLQVVGPADGGPGQAAGGAGPHEHADEEAGDEAPAEVSGVGHVRSVRSAAGKRLPPHDSAATATRQRPQPRVHSFRTERDIAHLGGARHVLVPVPPRALAAPATRSGPSARGCSSPSPSRAGGRASAATPGRLHRPRRRVPGRAPTSWRSASPSPAGESGRVVFHVDEGRLDDPAHQAAVDAAIAELGDAADVTGVTDPSTRAARRSSAPTDRPPSPPCSTPEQTLTEDALRRGRRGHRAVSRDAGVQTEISGDDRRRRQGGRGQRGHRPGRRRDRARSSPSAR